MAKMLPLKMNVFKCFADADGQSLTSAKVYELLKPLYEGERQFTIKKIQALIDSLLAVDMITDTGVEFDKQQNLVVYYKIGVLGKERIKYIES